MVVRDPTRSYFGGPAAGLVLPWQARTRVLEQREILASRLWKTVIEGAENSSQFALLLIKKSKIINNN
jgi:hypothetical protein